MELLQCITANEKHDAHILNIRWYYQRILKVGDGIIRGPNDGEINIYLPNDILIKEVDNPIKTDTNLQDNLKDCTYLKTHNYTSTYEYYCIKCQLLCCLCSQERK